MRKIIHIDMDCFFAAIEMLDHPEYKSIPMAVGGSPKNRGVISTCNYPAREYGIHSALSSAVALRKCPHLTLIPGRHELYKKISNKIFEHLTKYTSIIERVSIDEAYLDVTDSQECEGSATLMAQKMRKEIYELTGLTASAGISHNKFLAKIASDWRKPNGQYTVTPAGTSSFLRDLELKKLPGVGHVTAQKLKTHHLHTCADLKRLSGEELCQLFGKFGQTLYQYSRGIDLRPVSVEHDRKSLSCEHTYARDLKSWEEIEEDMSPLTEELAERLLRFKTRPEAREKFLKSLVVKMKFCDFQTLTRERQLTEDTLAPLWYRGEWTEELKEHLAILLQKAYNAHKMPVRLLGLGVKMETREAPSSKRENSFQQLSFYHKMIS